jgi:UDP-N-acetylglucosamine--N-acetylmuramyl-(pentapeptide) pyrophosphoryl-undecaprenol N-acetylglucosamine transferase
MIRSFLKENNITGVIGLGGFGSGAAVYEGHQLGLKTAFMQPDFVPGRANQWLSKYSEKIFVQWEGTQQYFERPVDVVGVPLKKIYTQITGPERARLREEGLKEFGLSADRKTLLITGGSTGAKSLNSAAMRAISDFESKIVETWQILHLTGSSDYERISKLYQMAGDRARYVKVLPYSNRMDLAYSLADLAICRAGAITLAELTAATVPSILLPYPYHKDNHQAKNANVLVQAGAAIMISDDKEAGPETVGGLNRSLQTLLFDDNARTSMVRGAETLRRTDAAEKVARWLVG